MAMSRIPGDEELYVGGMFTLRRSDALLATGITHIVSVLRYDFKDFQDWGKYEHLSVEVDDVADEDLLGEFERTGSWIEEALKGVSNRRGVDGEMEEGCVDGKRKGGVLVHCAMGKSRSVTVCIAYLLRQNPAHSVASALALIRESRPIAEPNEGFMEQLELYKDMGCPRDILNHPRYQRWLYQREVDLAVAVGMAPDRVRFEDEERQEEREDTGEQERELRCKRCRRTLATSPYLIPHTAPAARAPPASTTEINPQVLSLPAEPPPACTHHFLSPLSWMRTTLEQGLLAGRLECPNGKCKAQLGRYAWQGLQCSCGVWVCPAFSLLKGRVDELVRVRSVAGLGGGIRLPPGMKKGTL